MTDRPTVATATSNTLCIPYIPYVLYVLQTDEQRAQMGQAMANVAEGLRQVAEAFCPAALRAGEEIARFGEQLRTASSYRPEWANAFAYNPRCPR